MKGGVGGGMENSASEGDGVNNARNCCFRSSGRKATATRIARADDSDLLSSAHEMTYLSSSQ